MGASVSTGTIAAPENAEQAFLRGDYTRAAYGADTDELRGSALIMLGHHEAGLPLIERCQSTRARLYEAFGLWSVGEHQSALASLSRIGPGAAESEAARKLEALIRRSRIRMLMQGRDDPNCPDYDLVGAFRAIPQADVKTIGFASTSDVVVDHWYTMEHVEAGLPAGWTPDFYLNHLVEDNPPPIGIEQASFPTFCHTQDYDRHYQHCREWLRLFDAVVTLGSVDHDDMHRLTGSKVFVFPKLLGISSGAPAFRPGRPRPIDVFVSGSLFNLTRAKAEHLLAVSQLPTRYSVQMLDGYTTTDEYYRRLADAKATFTFVHRWGLINGRALEAISQGTCAVYQEGGELGLFLSEDDGAIPYRPDNAIEVLRRVVDQWESRYRRCGENGSRKVRDVFNFEKGICRYFYFLAFCTALGLPRRKRREEPPALRYPNRSPWRTFFNFDHSVARLAQLHEGFRAGLQMNPDYRSLDARGESLLYSALVERQYPLPVPVESLPSAPVRPDLMTRAINKLRRNSAWTRHLAGREHLKSLLLRLIPARNATAPVESSPRSERLLDEAIEVYQRLVEQFPNRLAARFNLGRLHYERGALVDAARTFDDLLACPGLSFEPGDLLFWREFHDEWLDYERIGQELVQFDLTKERHRLETVGQLVRSSALLYSASIHRDLGDLEVARTQFELYSPQAEGSPALWLLAARLEPDTGRTREYLRKALAADRTLIAALPRADLETLCEGPEFADIWQQRELLDVRRAA